MEFFSHTISWIIAILAVACCNATFRNRRERTRQNGIDSRIIGGTVAEPGQIPYIVSLRDVSLTLEEFHICGGGIVTATWVMTTSLCVYLENPISPTSLVIVAGETHLYEDGDNVQRMAIKEIYIHPNFSPSRKSSNIAMISLEEALVFNLYVKSLHLAKETDAFSGEFCDISGWGYTTPNGLDSLTLRTTSVVVRTIPECVDALGSAGMPDGTLCAGLNSGKADFCTHDEGGPLSCMDTFAGLASWNDNCGTPGSFGVYTSVAYFRPWIDSTMSSN